MLSFYCENEIENIKKDGVDNRNGDSVIVGRGAVLESFNQMKDNVRLKLIRIKRKFQFILSQGRDFLAKKNISIRNKRLWYGLSVLMLVLVFVGLVTAIGMFVWYSKDLPTPSNVVRREGYASRIYDRNGNVLYDVYRDAKRTPVKFEEIPNYLKQATIAIEDKDFYKHKGFDPLTPFRIAKNLVFNRRLIGGSTLTQQLVKNVLLTSERKVTRKIRELILAIQIEAKYEKDEILLMYLNESPYGGPAWGVGSASEQYFGKPVSELNLVESVILAGLPQRPNAYSPFSSTPTAYIDRTSDVLGRMVEDGYISEDLKNQALEEVKNYEFFDNQTTIQAPHFVFWVREELTKKYGEDVVEGGGLQVHTTLDLELHSEVQKIVAEEIDKTENLGISNGAALVMDPVTGEVLSMVGSRGYFSDKTSGKFNVVTQGLRQPGSAIKPVTYLVGLQKGFTPASLMMDVPITFPGGPGQRDYSPKNYNGKFNGPMTLRSALGNSINTTAVKMLANVGVENMLRQAYEMGMATLEPTKENLSKFGLAVTLGGAEVTMADMGKAYCSFANGGKKVDIVGVLKVIDKDGRVLEEYKPVEGKSVMTPQEAYLISNILSDNSARELTFGAVNGLIIPNYQVAVKTGTTNDLKDNWAIGWTPNLLVATWVGNNDNTEMKRVASGVSGATPIWRRVMLYELPKRAKQDFPIPNKIINLEVDRVSGYPAHDGFPSRAEYFIDGMEPKGPDPIHMKLKVCKGDFGLATPEDVTRGNFDEKEYIKIREDDPWSKDGVNRWQEGINWWINSQPDKDKYSPPEDYCREDGMVGVEFETPTDRSTVGKNFHVKIRPTSVKKIIEVKLWINGDEKKMWTERPYEINLDLDEGVYVLKTRATDKDGKNSDREIRIGVNVPWDWKPTPTETPVTPTMVLTPTAKVSPVPEEEDD